MHTGPMHICAFIDQSKRRRDQEAGEHGSDLAFLWCTTPPNLPISAARPTSKDHWLANACLTTCYKTQMRTTGIVRRRAPQAQADVISSFDAEECGRATAAQNCAVRTPTTDSRTVYYLVDTSGSDLFLSVLLTARPARARTRFQRQDCGVPGAPLANRLEQCSEKCVSTTLTAVRPGATDAREQAGVPEPWEERTCPTPRPGAPAAAGSPQTCRVIIRLHPCRQRRRIGRARRMSARTGEWRVA